MDRSKALNTLLEAAELTKMIEELMSPHNADRLAHTFTGMRVTLRSIRERIVAGHEMLAREMVSGARARTDAREEADIPHRPMIAASRPDIETPSERPANGVNILNGRPGLRTTIEKQNE